MNKTKFSRFLFMILFAAMIIISAVGCTKKEALSQDDKTVKTTEKTDSIQFTFKVVDRDGKETSFDITTDRETVGEALLDEKLIEGDEGEYGLYVKRVNGIEAIYENDGTYWSFYINGEYAMTGVDTTKVEAGATYTFKVEGQ